ncbi:proton-coupled amino acid transporter-like protein pathetic isoform X1 [Leptopilina heterotoma]|uniref:proton-coupled amino acid transporter-like protein pathetic isoform X1 n=1 Tax=Leptopilina heterotoma TaxID=63436 RepID=UPI001CA8AA8B|nr:proton-coupled amino acid transporter-like protein pathetic isoform X1 [Leptopilina heterotoma]
MNQIENNISVLTKSAREITEKSERQREKIKIEKSPNKLFQWLQVQIASRDGEAKSQKQNEKTFNPFTERDIKNPTTDGETFTHLLKACLGTGILSMPFAFTYSGLLIGLVATFLVGFVCTHCSYILVKCAHTLYYRTRRTQMSFADVAEVAFATGPKWGRKYSTFFRYFIQICLFVTYFGAVSVYTVIIAKNFQQVLEHYANIQINIRLLIACLLLPLIVLCWIPNLKYLAPFSMVANGFMGVSLAITFYYMIKHLHPLKEVPLVQNYELFPNFISITIFAMEAIGVMMPLENNMKTPQNFVGIFGVLNKGMFVVTVIYALLGFMGYCAFLEKTKDTITLNLGEELPAQLVKLFIAIAVFLTFGLQFFVCLDIVWNGLKERFEKKKIAANYFVRTAIVTSAVLLAIAVPTIGPFISLIGAFCFSILGLLIPIIIETVTYWDIGFGPGNWMMIKNIIIGIIGLIAVVVGSKNAISDIIAQFSV